MTFVIIFFQIELLRNRMAEQEKSLDKRLDELEKFIYGVNEKV